tara:strand:+ start:67 stop:381 length:315 start_codon:yes stop_codon:yes gene_type:complete
MTFRYGDHIIEVGDQVRIVKPGAELKVCKPFHGGHTWVRVPLSVGTVLSYSGQGTPAYSSWGKVPFFAWLDEAENHLHIGRLPEIYDHPQCPPRSDPSFYEVVA